MTLPTIEPLPDENANLPPARRRRQRRMIVPPDSSDKAAFLLELARRTVPSFDFFLFSLLAGLVLGAALLFDSPALIILAALIAPFMAPAVGISLGTITGAVRFVLQSIGSLSVGSLIVFLCGALAGWAANLLPAHVYQQVTYHSQFTWADFFVLVVGAGVTTYLIVRAPNQKPLVASVALAYELYLPVGAAGFGMSSGVSGPWPNGLGLFFLHLVWAAFIGTLVLGALGLRPLKISGYFLSTSYGILGLAAIGLAFLITGPLPGDAQPSAAQTQMPQNSAVAQVMLTSTFSPTPSQPQPKVTASTTPSPTPTRTLVPSFTPTITITTVPTPVYARISAQGGDGALIREKPSYDSTVIQSLLNETIVEVLPDVIKAEGSDWVHIRTKNDKEGWIVRSLLRTATPAPGW